MENKYKIGDQKRRDQIGLKGKTKVTWMACSVCNKERWVMPAQIKNNICQSCNAKNWVKVSDLNSFIHKETCKCYRCRIGKGYFKGENNPMWNGGIRKLKSGYVYQWIPDDSKFISMKSKLDKNSNYVMQHRLVMAEYLGRPLTKNETVHHINGIRDDNRIENLELWSSNHQSGQRVSDMINWAIEFLKTHNYIITKPKTNE